MTTITICTIGNAMSRVQREALAEDLRTQLRSEVTPRVLTVPVGVKLEFAEVGHFGEAKTSIGELTVKLDTSLVQDAIREMLEPGAMYLPKAAVLKLYSHFDIDVDLTSFGAIAASEASLKTTVRGEALEPGAVYLPPAAVKGFRVVLREFDSIVEQLGGVVAK